MTDHNHEDYASVYNVICQRCNTPWEICGFCNHTCKADDRVLPGYRVVPEFPDYMVNKQATVRHIKSQRYSMLMRVSKEGGAMINVLKEGKKFTRAAQALRDSAFYEEVK